MKKEENYWNVEAKKDKLKERKRAKAKLGYKRQKAKQPNEPNGKSLGSKDPNILEKAILCT